MTEPTDYSPLWERLKEHEKASGIGRYGLLLLGLSDGRLIELKQEPEESDDALQER